MPRPVGDMDIPGGHETARCALGTFDGTGGGVEPTLSLVRLADGCATRGYDMDCHRLSL